MEYNWGDPKKNSLLTSRMMAKAEITRKKRLTSVKSTLSNQLHPAIEHKLRKKKKAPDSARAQTSSSNNELHETHTHTDQLKAEPQLTSDDESSTLDTIRHDAFPVPARASYADNVSMFDEFGLNAAADGLFHPASTIEAFTEHDAKYHQEIHHPAEKPHSGPRRARSGSEYPPSRENHRLPALASGKNKRERLSTRKQAAGNTGSAPASMTTTSSLSKLVDAGKDKGSLSATQSDSNLYAPRRSDVVPSSADRNALDFLERELESDEDNNAHNSPVVRSSRGVSELDNNEISEESNSVVPALDFSLAKKFEELKRIMKSNREKHNSARQDPDLVETSGGCSAGPSTSTSTTASPKSSARSAIRAPSSGSSATKTGGGAASKVSGTAKRSAPVTKTMHSGSSGSKRTLANNTPGAASRMMSSSSAVAVTHPTRSKREAKVRSGVSLSDLKAEHREALKMLKELGGPVDPDYLLADVDHSSSNGHRPGRTSTGATGPSRSTGSTVAIAGRTAHKNVSNQVQARPSASTPPTSANSGISMVTKLRESISSGRSSSRESSPRTSSPTISSECKENDGGTTTTSHGSSDEAPSSSNQAPMGENATSVLIPDKPQAFARSSIPPPLMSNTADASDPWKQYEDDNDDDEEEGNNELERDSSSEVKRDLTSGDRYSDEDFESDW
ncbi:hypothetical protein PR003_g22281 [Phytophthora rubi]|uniref:Uncharacterized protein n=1 Tax=Phytophthora rubi TaxID=129364 RepID=A0A6A4D591_9STRA|nr:hypothetical protein PR003_g22281 [Phytophthora rubi]